MDRGSTQKAFARVSADSGLAIPLGMPAEWVVDCCNVGTGEPALKYLSRYLYRGVIRERDLISYDAKTRIVCFRYIDAITKKPAYRQLLIAEFLKPSCGLNSSSWYFG